MPKEQIRKRGKRKPKNDVEVPELPPTTEIHEPIPSTSATGIHPARAALLAGRPLPPSEPAQQTQGENGEVYGEGEGAADWTRGSKVDSEFPFGVLDPDVKAYFRSVEEQIKDWEGVSSEGEEREDRQLFLSSVLSELRSHELPTSTDPETSIILERLLPSLNDWGRRVIGDAFGDNWPEVIRHRFGSHVAQSWMTLAAGTLDREARDIWPPQQAKQDASVGLLPTMANLFTNLISTLLPIFPQLLSSPHAAPPLRLLLLILTPNRPLPVLGAEGSSADVSNGLIRSKRSNKFRTNQGVKGKSILGDEEGKGKQKASERKVPAALSGFRKQIRKELMDKLAHGEWKAMGVDAVGSATVQLLLEFEVEDGEAEVEGSLFDVLTEGLITHLQKTPETPLETQPYLLSLLASQTGTRLFESLLVLSPQPIFNALWSTYFEKKLGKLAGHPYANFVVAKGVARLDSKAIEGLIAEVKGVSGGRGLIKAARTSVLQALVERSVALGRCQETVLNLLYSCLELPSDKKTGLVPCLMALKTYPMYQAILTGGAEPVEDEEAALPSEAVDAEAEASAAAAARLAAWQNRRSVKPKAKEGEVEPNMQGCLILQGMMGMKDVNSTMLDSLTAQPVEIILTYAKSPIASHFIDSVFTNSTVPPKYRRKIMMSLQDHWRVLVDDRLGSRVVDTIWDRADGYMKEKIARTLIPHQVSLGQSQYGKYFIRRAEISLLDRRPNEWRERIVGVKHHFAHQQAATAPASAPVIQSHKPQAKEGAGEKRKEKEADEIDELFAGVDKKHKHKKRKV
ncbi:hypothetical protein I317_04406 [Kwoniella heveanensis CBS 569]|nr:hypothetical protein I317_04406 [Kwoniella heveanensis CBS 569]